MDNENWSYSTQGCTKHGWTKSGDEQPVTQQVGQSMDFGRDSPAIRRGLSTRDRHGNRVNLMKMSHFIPKSKKENLILHMLLF